MAPDRRTPMSPAPRRPRVSRLALALVLGVSCGAGDAPEHAAREGAPPLDRAAVAPPVRTPTGFVLRAATRAPAARDAVDLRAELGLDAAAPVRVVASPGGGVVVRRR